MRNMSSKFPGTSYFICAGVWLLHVLVCTCWPLELVSIVMEVMPPDSPLLAYLKETA